MNNENKLKNSMLTFSALLYKNVTDVMQLGENLVKAGADNQFDGGFWIWNTTSHDEFYSPKFRGTLGFEGEEDFPSTSESWQKYIDPLDLETAITNYKKTLLQPHETPYYQEVTYTKKDGSKINIICSGLLVILGGIVPVLMGTHIING